MVVSEVNLREIIFDVQQEERKTVYEKYVEPMTDSINEFVETLKSYCFENKIPEVRIFYQVMHESIPRFARISFGEKKAIKNESYYNEAEDAWLTLLNKWYFTMNGSYLLKAVENTASDNGFDFEYDYEGGEQRKEMVHFTLN
jgi:hypothetical protein